MHRNLRLTLIFLFILSSFFLVKVMGWESYFTPNRIQEIFEHNFFISTLIYILLFTVGNLLQVPGWVFWPVRSGE